MEKENYDEFRFRNSNNQQPLAVKALIKRNDGESRYEGIEDP